MRDRIKIQNLTILFICPSDRFGTLERRALNDCVYYRDIGGNPSLYCLEGSTLSMQAKKYDIPVCFYSGKNIKRALDLSLYSDIKKLISEERYDVVHCYNSDFIWMSALCLIANSKISLLLTENFVEKLKWGFFYKWLARRIDLAIVNSKAISHQIRDTIPLNPRKVQVLGGGIETTNMINDKDESKKIIGMILSRSEDLYKKVELLLYAIPFLLEKCSDFSFSLEFHIYCDGPWVTVKDFPKIQDLMEQLDIGDCIKFDYMKNSVDKTIQNFDIYVSTEFEEAFNDYEVMSLLYFVPVILPRTAARQELIALGQLMAETFYSYDSRELKDKILKVLIDGPLYTAKIQQFHQKLLKEHGMETYFERLTEHYLVNFEKRARITEKMAKSGQA